MSDDPDDDDRIEREHESPDDAEADDTTGKGDVEGVPDGEEDVDEETEEWLNEEQKNPDDRE